MHLGSASHGTGKRFGWMTAAAVAAAATAACDQPQAAALPPVPVNIGGETEGDACGGLGQVANLRPGGFVAVRTGPGARFAERDRLFASRTVWLCEERGGWQGIVYAANPQMDCGVATAQARRSVYRGPCRSGWVFGRYVELTAG